MAEKIIAEYELKTDKFRQQIKGVADDLGQVEKQGKEAGQSNERSFNNASNSVNKFGKSVTEADSPLKSMKASALELAGALGVAFGVQQVVQFTKDSINAASNLNETISKTGELFGATTDQVVEWSKTAGDSFGQSQQQALDAAASFAIFGKSAGLGGQDLVKFSTDFTALASDLASFNNTSPEEAIQAIGAALRGENEPIRRYGVLLDEASLKQAALSQGIIKSTKEALTPQQKVLAAQAEIYRQTTAAQGDFARTSDGLANQQRILAANFEDVKVKLGQELLPTVLNVVGGLNKISPQQFVALIKTIAVAVTTFLAVNGALKLASAATTAYRTVTLALAGAKAVLTGNTTRAAAAQRALGLSFASTPWGFIITAITTAASALFFFGNASDDAAESQDGLSEEMQKANDKMKEQDQRLNRIISSWDKFKKDKASLSVTELKDAIADLDAEIANTPVSGQRFVDQLQSQRFEIDQTTGKLVEVKDAQIVYSETQEEANKRQAANIAGLKARKKALEEQLALLDDSNKAEEKQVTALERVNKELQKVTLSIQNQLLLEGTVRQEDIDRLQFLSGKLEGVKERLDEIQKRNKPITIEFIIPEGQEEFDPAKRFEESLMKRNEAQRAADAAFLEQDKNRNEQARALLDSFNLVYAGAGQFRVKTDEDEFNQKRKQLEIFLNEGRISYEEYYAAIAVLDEELRNRQVASAQESIKNIGDVVNGIVQIVGQVQEYQRQQIAQTYEAEIAAVENSTMSEEAKAKKIEELRKKQAKDQYDLELKQFKTNKALAIVQAIINTAAGIAAQFQAGPVGIALAAIAAAAGAAQIAVIASQQPPPPPAFAQGTPYVERGKNKAGVDTIPAYLNEGEAVIPTDRNKAYPGLAKAWIAGNLDDYIVRNFVAPKLIDMERKAEKRMADSFAASLKGDGFDDARLLMATSEGNMYLKVIAKEMKTKQKKRTAW